MFLSKRESIKKDLFIIAVGGIMGFVISQFVTAISLQYTTPVYFSLIIALSPICVMLLSALFLKEPITLKKIIGVLLGISGAFLLIAGADSSTVGKNNLLGIGLACVSILAYSVYIIVIRSVSNKYSGVTQMKWMFLFAAIILLPFGIPELKHQPIYSSQWAWDGVLEIIFLIVFATSTGYFLMPIGLKYLRATTVSVYMNLQPIIASVAAIFLGQDIFSWNMPISAVLVLCGAYVVSKSKAKGD